MLRKSLWRRSALFALALGIAGSLSVHSAPRAETAQDAASAKALLGEVFEYLTTLITSTNEDLTLELGAEPSAQPSGSRVEMIFPAPSILDRTGGGFHLGNVTASVTPQEKDQFRFSVGLPNSMTVSEAGGITEGEVSWGAGALRGVWRADLRTATEIHGSLKSLIFTDINQNERQVVGKINSVAMDQEFAESANGWWSGPFVYDATNIEVSPADRDENVSLGKLSVSGELQDFDLYAWQALSEWGDSISAAVDGTGPTSFGGSQAVARIFEAMNLGAGNTGLLVSDLSYGPPGRPEFKMGELNLSMNYDNGARPGAYSFNVDWQGLEQTDSDIPAAYFTHTGALKMHLEQFPLRQIVALTLRETENLSPPIDSVHNDFSAPLQFMILPLINANQTRLRLEKLVLRSSIAALAASGNLSAENDSALGVVGDARLELAGLDRLIAAAARQALSGEDATEMLAFLTFAKGLGRPEPDAEGELVYVYDVVLPADGIVLINEIPLDLLQNSGLTALPQAPDAKVQANSETSEAPRS
ncbi:MAG: hypothetical protein O3B21_07790 [Proteobacteria bacterium]|nr:hypothetical protein [Pseudomonadota bacterium]MDA1357128.1 hypothetical protein [Pseudomonadota bacterium]